MLDRLASPRCAGRARGGAGRAYVPRVREMSRFFTWVQGATPCRATGLFSGQPGRGRDYPMDVRMCLLTATGRPPQPHALRSAEGIMLHVLAPSTGRGRRLRSFPAAGAVVTGRCASRRAPGERRHGAHHRLVGAGRLHAGSARGSPFAACGPVLHGGSALRCRSRLAHRQRHTRHRATASYAHFADAHLVQAAERVGSRIADAIADIPRTDSG